MRVARGGRSVVQPLVLKLTATGTSLSEHVLQRTIDEVKSIKPNFTEEATWNVREWLKRVDVTHLLEKAILHLLHERSDDPRLELIFMRRIAELSDSDKLASQVCSSRDPNRKASERAGKWSISRASPSTGSCPYDTARAVDSTPLTLHLVCELRMHWSSYLNSQRQSNISQRSSPSRRAL